MLTNIIFAVSKLLVMAIFVQILMYFDIPIFKAILINTQKILHKHAYNNRKRKPQGIHQDRKGDHAHTCVLFYRDKI